MNKKLRVLFSLSLLLSAPVIANECEPSCDPCQETTNTFCGGYIGANFNFGSVNFLSKQDVTTEVSVSRNNDSTRPLTIIETTRKDSCLKEALSAVGGGVTLGWAWANSCWYLAGEFNGLFYGNVNSNLSDDCCDTSCNDKCCGYVSESSSRYGFSQIGALGDVGLISYTHRYKNNIRLDGVAKLGYMLNSNTALYVLGGGSGLLVQYSNAINAQEDVSSASEGFNAVNDISNNFCCNKWIGGGTVGFGSRMSWCDCLDVIIEGRYARYANTCYSNSKANDVDGEFVGEIVPSDLAEQDSTKFRTDSYMALVGLNWRF